MPRDSLESVYRLIASNSFLEAIHMINKLLKKQPNNLIAKVWKCEALYGLGNVAESEELMTTIIDQSPGDKKTLECIADFYRARGNYSKLVEVYENALKSDANDENWKKALFECCGLAGDYKKQQQQALQLYKQSPRMLFYCMAVVCLLQQAEENPVALDLAERMMVRQSDSGKIKSRNEVLLFMNVLERRGKTGDALEILNKSSTELETLISTFDKRIELLSLLNRWPEVIKLLKTKLKSKPDHWLYLKQYVSFVVKYEGVGGSSDDPDVDDSFAKARSFLESLGKENTKLRGPSLAVMELIKVSSRDNSELVDLIVEYFDKFAEKAISVYDLSSYVSVLSQEQSTELLRKLATMEFDKVDLVKLQTHLKPLKHISFLQLSRLTGIHSNLTAEERIKLCASLKECYRLSEGSERNEHYLLIMTHERANLFRETGDSAHLVHAAAALEDALLKSQTFTLQVILLQVYFALGASKAARKLYEHLRIQSVQVDTLVHLFLYSISSTGHFTIASEMWENAAKIMHQCTAESLEALVWCYRAGLFHRVEEFTSCARRFQRSITVPLLRGERAFLDLLTGEPARAEQVLGRIRPPVTWVNCLDNRDVKALPLWEQPSAQTPREQSYDELLLFCKLREMTMLCLASAISESKASKEDNDKSFHLTLDALQALYSEAVAKSSTQNNCLTACSTRLHVIAQIPLPSMLEKTMHPEQASSEKLISILKQSTDSCIDAISKHRSKNPRLSAEVLVSQMEALAVLTVAVGAAKAAIAPSSSQRRHCVQIASALTASWTALDAVLPVTAVPEVEDTPSKDIVVAKLHDNYQLATEDMRKVIRKKIVYLHKVANN